MIGKSGSFITIVFLIALTSFIGFGQNSMIDSLETRLSVAEGEDRIKTLILLSYNHLRISVEKSLEFSQMALEYSKKTGNTRKLARAYLMIGSGYNEKGNTVMPSGTSRRR
ncbi:MAG: hypothetical protein R2764_04300 [Bacteroidales bacterium]